MSPHPPAEKLRPVTFTTDFGAGSEHVGALHARVVAHHAGISRLDFAHDIAPGEVRWGALQLARCVELLPDAVHVAVIDPGVGTSQRQPVIVQFASGGFLVGPDNGLLGVACDARLVRGAFQIDPSRMPHPVSSTFHGRDIFAPVAARLATGDDPADWGAEISVATISRPRVPPAVVGDGIIATEVAGCDAYGNIQLLAGADDVEGADLDLGDHVKVEVPTGRHVARFVQAFADAEVGDLALYVDSHGMLALALNRGSAKVHLDVASHDLCCVTREDFGDLSDVPG